MRRSPRAQGHGLCVKQDQSATLHLTSAAGALLTQILRRAVKNTASISVSGVSIYYGKRYFVILVFSPWKALLKISQLPLSCSNKRCHSIRSQLAGSVATKRRTDANVHLELNSAPHAEMHTVVFSMLIDQIFSRKHSKRIVPSELIMEPAKLPTTINALHIQNCYRRPHYLGFIALRTRPFFRMQWLDPSNRYPG